jgi:hypothetical protein
MLLKGCVRIQRKKGETNESGAQRFKHCDAPISESNHTDHTAKSGIFKQRLSCWLVWLDTLEAGLVWLAGWLMDQH